MKRFVFFAFLIFSLAGFPVSAREKSDSEILRESMKENFEGSSAVSIPMPRRKSAGFFDSVDSGALSLFEDGSAESLRQACSKIRRNDGKYSDAERVLLFVARSVMEICWAGERSSEIPKVSVDGLSKNPYVGAVDFARDGIYDFSVGTADFFCLVLPSLALLSPASVDDYFESSQSALESALERRPSSVLANYLFGVLLMRQSRFSEAAGYLENSAVSGAFEISYRLAECYLSGGDSQRSLRLAEALFSDSQTRNIRVEKICSRAAFDSGDMDLCESHLLKVLRQEPDNREFLLMRVRVMILKGDWIRASSLLDSFAKIDPESREYLLLRARVQREWSRNVISALFSLETALRLYPDDLEVLLAAAEFASEEGVEVAEMGAGELARKILEMDPGNRETVKIQVRDYARRGEWDSAYKLSSALEEVSEIRDSAAEWSLRNRSLQDSDGEIQEPVKIDPIVLTHVEVCLSSGRTAEAWKIAEKIYQSSQEEDVVQVYIKALVATSRRKEALSLISRLLPESQQKMKSFLFYEKSLLDRGEDEILDDLRSSLSANPKNEDSLHRLYSIYYGKKEYRKAQFYLKQLFALKPNDARIQKLNENLDSIIKSGL